MIWLLEAWGLLGRSKSRALLLTLCWTLLLVLAGVAGWAWRNSPLLRDAWTRRVPAEVYLERADASSLESVRQTLARGRSLEWAGWLDAAAAAEEFRQGFDLDVVELLGENPFPATVLLKVRPEASLAQVDRDLAELAALPGVSGVHLERELLGELGRTLRRAGQIAVALLAAFSALTLALLAAAVRGLRRAWAGEAALLALQGTRAWRLALPVLLALLVPAFVAGGLALAVLHGLEWLGRSLGLGSFPSAPGWPLGVGIVVPLVLVMLSAAGAVGRTREGGRR